MQPAPQPLLPPAQLKLSARFFLLHLELFTGVAWPSPASPPPPQFDASQRRCYHRELVRALVTQDARVTDYFRRIVTDALVCGVNAALPGQRTRTASLALLDRPRGTLMYWYKRQRQALAEAIGALLCENPCK